MTSLTHSIHRMKKHTERSIEQAKQLNFHYAESNEKNHLLWLRDIWYGEAVEDFRDEIANLMKRMPQATTAWQRAEIGRSIARERRNLVAAQEDVRIVNAVLKAVFAE